MAKRLPPKPKVRPTRKVEAEIPSELHFGVDAIVTELRRAYPGELEAGELAEETGLNDSEMREALKDVKRLGQLDEDADQFKWRDPTGGTVGRATPAANGDGEPPESDPPDRPANVPGSGVNHRGVVTAKVPFQVPIGVGERAPGGAVERAEEIAKEIAEMCAERFGSAMVTLDEIEAFDSPRTVFRRGDPSPDRPEEEADADDDAGEGDDS
jgi:hypothetical protein